MRLALPRTTRPLAAALAVLLLLTLLPGAARATSASANDDIADATEIPSIPVDTAQVVSGFDTFETDEPTPSCASVSRPKSVWYRWTADADGEVGLVVPPRQSLTSVAVYEGGPVLTSLVELACAYRSTETFEAAAGTTYWIQLRNDGGREAAFRLGRHGSISGTVTHPVDGPVADATVELGLPGDRYDVMDVTTDVAGTWSAEVVEGDWQVRVTDKEQRYAPEWHDDAVVLADADPVPVPAGTTTVVDVELAHASTLTGAVLDLLTGAAVPDGDWTQWDVWAEDVRDDNALYYGEVVDGSYTIPGLPAGSYVVTIEGPDPYDTNWYDGTHEDQADFSDVTALVVPVETTVDQDAIAIPGHVVGTLLDAKSGDPAVGVDVELHQAGALVATTTTDVTGRYVAVAPTNGDVTLLFAGASDLYDAVWHDGTDGAEPAAATDVYLNTGRDLAFATTSLDPTNVAPTLPSASFSVRDDAAVGTVLGTVAGSDRNTADTLTHTITAGNVGGAFALDAATGRLTVAATLDADARDSYALTVEARDDNSPSLAATAVVTVSVTPAPVPSPATAPSAGFTDTAGSVFVGDIDWLAWVGVTRGCNPPTNDRFCPDDGVTRGQMAAFLTRALDLPAGTSDRFGDDDTSIFEDDIDRLAAAGITLGCNPPANDRFCPDATVTRGQMAAFMVRALDLVDGGDGDLFTDDDGSVFERDIDRLATAGITLGCNPPTNDRYCPDATVTRGQMAAFLHRALGDVLTGD